jgi:hypothetical protein
MVTSCPQPIVEDAVEQAECLILTKPEWFEREDFLDWRQGKADGQWCSPACWLPAQRRGEYTDVFLSFDRRWLDVAPCTEPGCEHVWEGSDSEGFPADIYEEIGTILHDHGLQYGMIWIKAGDGM